MLWLILCQNGLDLFSVSNAPILTFIDYRKDGPKLFQEAGQRARPEQTEPKWCSWAMDRMGEASRRLKPSQCSLFNARFGWLSIFLAIFTWPTNFHIFGWLLSHLPQCLPLTSHSTAHFPLTFPLQVLYTFLFHCHFSPFPFISWFPHEHWATAICGRSMITASNT